jgi:hypothetical protein
VRFLFSSAWKLVPWKELYLQHGRMLIFLGNKSIAFSAKLQYYDTQSRITQRLIGCPNFSITRWTWCRTQDFVETVPCVAWCKRSFLLCSQKQTKDARSHQLTCSQEFWSGSSWPPAPSDVLNSGCSIVQESATTVSVHSGVDNVWIITMIISVKIRLHH